MSDQKVLYRSLSLAPTDAGRTIVAPCIVPYNRVARVADGDGPAYDEMFAPGVFARNLRAPHHVLIRSQHAEDFLGVVGRAVRLDDSDEQLAGEFVALDSNSGHQALAMIKEGIYTGASVGFVPIRNKRGSKGEIVRVSAHLDHVALVMEPAYSDAAALSVRSASVPALDDLRPPVDADLDKRLTALGLER
jgi:HK97 family phage prohead protease